MLSIKRESVSEWEEAIRKGENVVVDLGLNDKITVKPTRVVYSERTGEALGVECTTVVYYDA
jgi:hypothetical protein